MRKTLSDWALQVHEFALSSGKPITAREAVDRFGVPSTKSTAPCVLHCASLGGWFKREEYTEEGSLGPRKRVRFTALAVPSQVIVATRTASYFHGIKRCRSVFELADTL